MLYISILIYILILVYHYDYRQKTRNYRLHHNILLFIFILVGGLSYRLGIDLIRYEEAFHYSSSTISDLANYFKNYEYKNGQEPLWLVFMALSRGCTSEFAVFHFIIVAFFNITVFWFLKKYSPAFFTSVFLYAVLAFFHFNFQILRESLAICFVLIAYSHIMNDKPNYIKYYLWIVFALLFHRFAYIALLLPLIKFIKRGGRGYVIVLLVVVFTSGTIIMKNLAFFLNTIFGENLATAAGTYLREELTISHNLNGYIWLFVSVIIPLYYIFTSCSSKNTVFMSFGLVYILFAVLSFTSVLFFNRVMDYLFFPMVIAFSDAIENRVYHPVSQESFMKSKIVISFFVLFYIGVNLYNTTNSKLFRMYYPYSSIIEKKIDNKREQLYKEYR